ncbi:MAG: hypothetical protein H6574_11255 [Lewinellaceae bacterium]|nr:hypothetical protein [Lewinellaceae bacterium]MCB9331653.1 hypothetical protein [Lewinellaceae bacterium]
MKFSIKHLFLLGIAVAALAGCRKDSTDQTDVIIPPIPTVKIQTGVIGFVVDESGVPLEAATVRMGTNQIQTDANGYFELNGLANEIQPFVQVEKAGFFPSLSSFSTKAGDVGRVKVTLRTKTLAGQLNSGTGAQVDVPGGGTISFPSDGFVDAAGQPYNGPVLVYATYLDPSKPETNQMIPASFLGQAATGEAQVLHSFGMIHALLETPAGARLQLREPAKITVPVPADRLSNAPAEIPLWYIDEATGIWKEEGSAVLNGSEYKGYVSHFSWWNCDAGFPVVQISGILRIGSAHPAVEVRITRPNGASRSGIPSASGYFEGKVPANETLVLEVINECGNVVFTQTIGPFSTDTDLGIFSLDWTTDWVEVSGTLLNCAQEPVTNGHVFAWTNNQAAGNFPILIDPADGSFSGAIANCGGTDVTLVGYDLDSLKTSQTLMLPVSQQVNFGNVVACDVQLNTGVLIDFGNGTQKFINNATAEVGPTPAGSDVLWIRAVDNQGNGNKVNYEFAFLDWNQNPADPLWGVSVQRTLFGQPVYYDIQIQSGTNNVDAIQVGTQPGELVIFKLNNVLIAETPGNNIYQNCTITLTAIIQ